MTNNMLLYRTKNDNPLTLTRCWASADVSPFKWTSFQMHVLLRLFIWPICTHSTHTAHFPLLTKYVKGHWFLIFGHWTL